MNKVIIVGHLGQDPELRYTASQTAVCNISVATKERGKDGVDRTEWHRVILFNKNAENAQKYLAKGRQILIEGRLQTRQWEDKDGIKRYVTEIICDRMEFVGSNPNQQSAADDGQKRTAPDPRNQQSDPFGALGDLDDIPF